MTCYLVTSPFEDCSCHGSDVHDDDTSRIGGIFSGRAGRGGSGCVEQGRCTRFLYQMHGGHQLHEHNWAFEERSIKRLCFIRADVATADVNTELRSYAKLPSGIQTGDDGVLRTRLLLAVAPLPLRRATIREAAKSRDTALERLRTRK